MSIEATDDPSARQRIRAWRAARGRRLAVLDDDPTGSQSVHGVQVVTVLERDEFAGALADPGSVAFVLTNTRGLPEPDAVALNSAVVGDLLALHPELDIVSRSDSTLRGHVLAEVRAIEQTRHRALQTGYDGVILAPSFFEAGRYTENDVHFATIGGRGVPVGDTEFAADATFGYASSDLRDFVAEKSGGAIDRDDVLTISLTAIRDGGPDAVQEVLMGARDGAFVVVNATGYADYETVVLGVQQAVDAGRSFLFRTGPSFVRALAGLEPKAALRAGDFPQLSGRQGHGLVVVGSHVSQTSRQVAAARASGSLAEVELDVAEILRDGPGYLADAIHRVRDALEHDDVLVFTSRRLVTGADAGSSLDIARTVSAAVSDVVAGALAARPAWVVAKGGITSHDVAVHGLGVRRARVVGQLLPGMISVLDPISAAPEATGTPYVVFAGNVGDDDTLAHVIEVLRSAQHDAEVLA